MAAASLKFTGSARLVSRNAGGGDDATALDDATAFAVYLRMRLDALPTSGNSYIFMLVDAASESNWAVAFDAGHNTGTGLAGAGVFVRTNNGVTNGGFGSSANFGAYTPGMVVTLIVSGYLDVDRWRWRQAVNGVVTAEVEGEAGYDTFGMASAPGCRLVLGDSTDGCEVAYDAVTVWKDRALTADEMLLLSLGGLAPASLAAANQVIHLTGDGDIGDPIESGDPGRTNSGGHAQASQFTTGDTAILGTGTATYAADLTPVPTLGVEAWIPESGKSIGFRIVCLDGGAEFASMYTFNAPADDELPFHPTIKVNGGSPVALANPIYDRTDLRYVYYPLTGGLGVLAGAIESGDTVTFSVAVDWLRGKADGAVGITEAYADEPATNRAGDVASIIQGLPGTRALKVGANVHPFTMYRADWAPEAVNVWGGSSLVLDDNGDLLGFSGGEATRSLLDNAIPPRRVGYAWRSDHGPEMVYGMPIPSGTWTITYKGAFTWDDATPANRDRIMDYGAPDPGGLSEFTGKPVSFADVANVVAEEDYDGEGTHRVTFDLTYDTGTTGHAPDVTPAVGDDFVRPSPAIATQLVYSARGASGARTEMKLYPPGNAVGDEWDATTRDGMIAWDPYILRFLYDGVPQNYISVPDLSYCRRDDDPSRPFVDYDDVNRTVAISQIAMYDGGGYNAGYLPATSANHNGGLLVVTTATPHGLADACNPAISGGRARIPILDNGGASAKDVEYSTLGVPWDGRKLIVRVLSPTELLVAHAWNDQLTEPWTLATDPLTEDLGSLVVRNFDNRHTIEECVGLAAETDAIPWFCVCPGFTDAAITEYVGRIEAALPAGRKLILEWANELWNFIFDVWQYTWQCQESMPGAGAAFTATVGGGAITGASITTPGSGYFFGHDGYYDLIVSGDGSGGKVRAHFVDGEADSVEVVAAGTGYTSATLALPANNGLVNLDDVNGMGAFAAIQAQRVRKVATAAWVGAGRDAADLMVASPGQGENPGHILSVALYARNAGWPVDFLSPATYDITDARNSTPGVFSQYNDDLAYRQLDVDQTLDGLEMHIAWQDAEANIRALREGLDAMGLTEVPIWGYEGGLETVVRGYTEIGVSTLAERNNRMIDYRLQKGAIFHPRFARLYQGWLAKYEAAGLDVHNEFEWNGDGVGSNNRDETWQKLVGTTMRPGPGDGSGGGFDNLADPYNLLAIEAPTYHAFAEYNGVSGPAITVPTPAMGEVTQTTAEVTVGAASGGTGPYTYRFERRPGSSGTPADVGAGPTLTMTGLSAGTAYQVRAKATDATDAVGYSAYRSFTTDAAPDPGDGASASLGNRNRRRLRV
jgi:hypothetical protein